MKYLLTLVLLIFGIRASLACKCEIPTIAVSYVSADFVARLKILKVYPNQREEDYYKADIEVLELYKGPRIESIYIGGRSDGKLGTSCDVFFPEGSDLLVAARAEPNGKILFGACSFTYDFDRSRDDRLYALKAIEFLSQKYGALTLHYRPIISSNYYDFLFSKKGIQLNGEFAIYEVVLDDHISPSEVKVIKGFGEEVDSELVDELLKSKWEIRFYPKEDEIDGTISVIVPVFYYPAERGEKSFLSTFVL